MSTAALLRMMEAKGLSLSDAADLMEAFESVTPNRGTGADRQRRYRERKKDRGDVTNNVTSNGVTSDAPDKVPQTPKINPPAPIPSPPKGDPSLSSDPFEGFWAAYPSKVGKRAAERAFVPALRRAGRLAVMLAAIERQRSSRKWREGIIPNPATWLNQDRWLDGVGGPEPPNVHDPRVAQWRVANFHETGEWNPDWGERPLTKTQAA